MDQTREAAWPDASAVLGFVMGFLSEFAAFMLSRKKYWLFPTMATLLLLGGLLVVTKGSAVAPFIYALF